MKTVKLYILGAVQGVFFRNFVKENAEKLGLKGFARNLDDGRVEIVIEGDLYNINKMIELCKKGPKHAEVKDIKRENISYQGFDSFKILTV